MPLPPVVIELAQADQGSPNAAELVRACTEAASGSECRTGGAADEAGARAIVIVSWADGRQQARIEIGLSRDGKSRWVSRQLVFKDSDPEPERWRAVGLVVGTLVGETEREAEPSPPAPAPPPTSSPPAPAPTPSAPRPLAPASPERPPRLWLGVEGLGGPALDDGTWRLGAGVFVGYDVPGFPVMASVAARYLARGADEQQVDARWFGVSLGLGLHTEPVAGARIEGRGEALLERIEASVSGARRDFRGRWYPGMRLVLAGGPKLGDWGLLMFGGELSGISQGTVITLENQAVGRAPPLTWTLGVGARVKLD